MKNTKASVLAIERLRMLTDGVGVTTLVCFMGCPLRCRLCLNPASWDSSYAGMTYTAEELYEKLKIDHLYFVSTGGGVTFGGGEPLLHSAFIKEFVTKYRDTGWTFNLESSLGVTREHLDDVIPYMNSYLIDTKDMDEKRYKDYTNADYKLFYDNLLHLKEKVGEEKITVRVPYIPDYHSDDHREQKENAEKLKALGFSNIDMFDYVYPESRNKHLSENAMENRNR